MFSAQFVLGASLLTGAILTQAFDGSRYDNVAVYWGQNSHGAADAADTADYQKTLSYYCEDDAIDVIPIAFVYTFFSTGGLPAINLANTCNPTDNSTFSGTNLADCSALASDIETCQAKGKILTISLGGAGGSVGFTDDSEAETFADTIWNLFLGGSSDTRPFGSAVLDGVDLDVESGGSTGYAAFVTRIRSYTDSASKTYYITAAPQCVYPDSALGGVLNAVGFDAVYVQFCENNQCGLQNFGTASDWDFGLWDNWARTVSPNPDVKIYIGAPASSTAAGGGYQDISTLSSIAVQMRNSYPSFGGVMLWDASQAYPNDRYDLAIKNALVAAGGTGFTYPACSAAAFSSGTSYSGGSQVSYGGYIWEAKWYATATPANDPNSDWSAISACGGGSVSATTTSKATLTTTTTAPTGTTTTTTSAAATTTSASSGTCAGISAWSSSVAYVGGSQVTYNGDVWTASYWTEADTPGGSAGVWVDGGACTTAGTLKSAVSGTPVASASSAASSTASVKASASTFSASKASASSAVSAKAESTPKARNLNSRFFRL
ncbi:glycoside hydrolase [Stereum hirsutum FP-91666 SS1]|uniref:glycoside hydrolase n=1 Tax=Stereum hirsutum (strain FP-91666) TaxID=721885 RepID=UPI000444A4E4|nr:glycoside hydrolase [Stereum hirsutum FP-91666 SS1]EIM83467.1 glycoside hydrolase [Stereum hirsutum FP-91666 SS1]